MFSEIIGLIIEINTSLLFGLSLTDIELSEVFKSSLLISAVIGITYYTLEIFFVNSLIIILIYLLIIPLLYFILRLPLLQNVIIVLLSLVFNLSVIEIFQKNLLEVLMIKSGLATDMNTIISMQTFISLNNIVMSIIIYNSSVVFFQKTLFPKRSVGENSSSSYNMDVYFTIGILLILNFGLTLIFYQLPNFTYKIRISFIVWSLIFSTSILFYQSKSIKYKNQITEFLLDYKYQEDILDYYAVIRSQRHDFNFHLNSLYNMILNEEFYESKIYIEDIVGEARYINDLLPIHHPAIGAMLNTFKEIAAQKNIKISYYIMDDLRKINCSIYEINKILGNLIQNAIDELEKGKSNIIDVEIYNERDSTYIIKVTNETEKSEEELGEIFSLNYSTKDVHEGIGLPTVQNILLKYSGSIYTELQNKKISFIVRLPIN